MSGVEGQLGKLFSKEVDAVYEMPVDDVDEIQGVESSLLLNHAQLIADYDKVFDDLAATIEQNARHTGRGKTFRHC